MRISLNALPVLDVIARNGCFSAVGAELQRGAAPCPFGHHRYTIQKPEQYLEVNLFDRSGHRAHLGKRIAHRARRHHSRRARCAINKFSVTSPVRRGLFRQPTAESGHGVSCKSRNLENKLVQGKNESVEAVADLCDSAGRHDGCADRPFLQALHCCCGHFVRAAVL